MKPNRQLIRFQLAHVLSVFRLCRQSFVYKYFFYYIVGKVLSEVSDAAIKSCSWMYGVVSFGKLLVVCDWSNSKVLFYELDQ